MPQSFAGVYIHAVFSTKDREPLIVDAWREELFAMLGAQVNRLGCQSITVGGMPDHVHLLFGLSRTTTIADVLMEIKKWSSTWVNQKHPSNEGFRGKQGMACFR